MEKEIISTLDPLVDSTKYLMIIAFTKSRSSSYPMALNIAKGADVYTEMTIDKKIVHLSAFNKCQESASKALGIINYLSGTKSLQIFCNGKLMSYAYYIIEVLECYLKACFCDDVDAHCKCVIDDPFSEKYHSASMNFTISLDQDNKKKEKPMVIQRYLFPCKYLLRHYRFQKGHPSKIEKQIQAAAVEHNCNWCPYLNPISFKKLPKKTVFPDGTEIIEK